MQQSANVGNYQQAVVDNDSVEIGNISRSWSSVEVAADIHSQHVWNSKQPGYRCADIRPYANRLGLKACLTALLSDLCTNLQNIMDPADEMYDLLAEWTSLYGGVSDESEDDETLVSAARPEELFPSPKFFYELYQAMTLLARCKTHAIQSKLHRANVRGDLRSTALQIPGAPMVYQQLHTNAKQRCIWAFKPLIDEWLVLHPGPPSVDRIPPHLAGDLDMLKLRQCIVILYYTLSDMAVERVLQIATICSQIAMDIMEFQPFDLRKNILRQYLLPKQRAQQRQFMELRTVVTFPQLLNVFCSCLTTGTCSEIGRCHNNTPASPTLQSGLFRISDSLTVLALRHTLAECYDSAHLLQKNQHGVFCMNFYLGAVVDTLSSTTILQHLVDQDTQENTSIVQLFLGQPSIQEHQGLHPVLYVCHSTHNGRIPLAAVP